MHPVLTFLTLSSTFRNNHKIVLILLSLHESHSNNAHHAEELA